MVSRFRGELRRPSPAFVLAAIALFVALGGTGAYAVDKVTSKEIGNREVKRADLDRNAVVGSKVAKNSLEGPDLSDEPRIASKTAEISPGGQAQIQANCPKGQVVSGGGWMIEEGQASALDAAMSSASPTGIGQTSTGWLVILQNTGSSQVTANSVAMCVPK